ncbi:MAG: hypothetical protein KIS79_13910 [Burkholderiales bacterium]|nr:hypothetical protein [Burkholderiales bacterium]MCW5622197.1 hypothetical protein [Burkholderiales bacterium]
MRLVLIPALVCCTLFAAAGTAMAAGIPTDKAELTQEITLRCVYDMGEFGNDGVQACIRADMAAAETLAGYPPEAKSIVDRCFSTLWSRGYGMVQRCVERDWKAAAPSPSSPSR